MEKGQSQSVKTDINGFYTLEVSSTDALLVFTYPGFQPKEEVVNGRKIIDVILLPANRTEDFHLPQEMEMAEEMDVSGNHRSLKMMASPAASGLGSLGYNESQNWNTESYSTIHENGFKRPQDSPFSTFSIDVDAASYSNVRRFINSGQMPPKDAIRIEEMINYFSYDYDEPSDSHPFSINTEMSKAPWNEEHFLVQIGLQGKSLRTEDLPASNLVFLLDVSGSMNDSNKLPLLKSSLKMLANELRPVDRVSIVVYAGAAGLVLPPTSGSDKKAIIESLDRLSAGGSTAGGAGIRLAYQVAEKNLIEGGNNRIVLATDGDFNIGASSDSEMERLIEEKRGNGVFLTVLGFGMGNYKDSKMEILADKGNGNYAYIDNNMEAKKVLVNEFGGTLFTIAKDVKLQVEFNPKQVQAYRLIGYENRLLNDEDFHDDKKDAGELGSGHTVTALYEVIPHGIQSDFVKPVDPPKYQTQESRPNPFEEELLTVKFRYKEPESDESKLIVKALELNPKPMSENLRWASAVASYGMVLRNSKFKGTSSFDTILSEARMAKGEDENGYRNEFIRLVEVSQKLNLNN